MLSLFLPIIGHINKGEDYQILQGECTNQLSTIHVKVVDDGIWVSGSSVIVMEGKLYL